MKEYFFIDTDVPDDAIYNLDNIFVDEEPDYAKYNLNEVFQPEHVDEPDNDVDNLNNVFCRDDIEEPDTARYVLKDIFNDDGDIPDVFEHQIQEVVKYNSDECTSPPRQLLNSPKLNLTTSELNVVSSVAKERKLIIAKTDLLYNKDYTAKATNFVHNFRFLTSVYNSSEITNAISTKIYVFLKNYQELYFKLLDLTIKLSRGFTYGKSAIKRDITEILVANDFRINNFIDELYSLGKVVSQYDPDREIGIA